MVSREAPLTFAGHVLKRDERGDAGWMQMHPTLQIVSLYKVPDGTWSAHVGSGTIAGFIRVEGFANDRAALLALENQTRRVYGAYADLLGYEVDHG